MRLFLIALIQIAFVNAFSQSELKTENIILITMDGLRWQELFTGADSSLISDKQYVKNPQALSDRFWRSSIEARRETLMPFFWSTLQEQGQLYGFRDHNSRVNCSNQQWFSYPGYSEILCGFADDERINSNDKIKNPNTTVLEFINQQPAYTGKVAAFGSWDVFPFIINEQRSNIPVNAGFETSTDSGITDKEQFLNTLQPQIPSPWSTVRHDAFTHHYAMEYIKRKSPRIIYIAYGETDDFAHDGHYDAYLKSANQTDDFIAEVWNYAQNHPQYAGKTTMIITTDHGRGTVPKDTWRSHGIKVSGAGQIWIAVIGPDSPGLGIVSDGKQYYQNQVAATLAKFLGFEYKNAHPVGEAIQAGFKK